MKTLTQMKEAIKADGVAAHAGEQFEGKNGAICTLLAELSARGKPQAEITCTVEGCTETHVREISDWHQSDKCRTHAKSKSKGARTGTGLRSVKVTLADGTVETLREQRILDTDDAEMRALKEENNALFNQAYAKQEAARNAEKEQAKKDREVKLAAEKAERDAKKLEEKKAALKANAEKIKAVSAQMGVPVSQKTLAEIDAA